METKRPRLRRYHEENTPYFVTTRVAGGKPLFADTQKAHSLVDVLYGFRRQERYYLLSFVVMPDHLHLVLVPRQGWDISRIMHSVKRGSARLVNREAHGTGTLWQPRFFDRALRDEAGLSLAVEYIHNNPVKAGLAEKAEDYRFSSANGTYETYLARYMDAQVGTTCATGNKEAAAQEGG